MAKALGFGYPKSELEAYLRALQSIKESSDGNHTTPDEIECVYDLYARIQAQYRLLSLLKTSFTYQTWMMKEGRIGSPQTIACGKRPNPWNAKSL
ncbi:hypothetical protein BO79DRAFT_253642 [Aspergillus costaricaensis CBS 115574]|uniref:Uncharacterized protein n=1 Tax=Aspergillus costaricaensis CBS 115574 TaxID=1448317 RepID=A0ACD1IIL0_9EURO|nr:hypothetical protein BO79DRAFT_253642 [Aspergillus costaricaensis CBS 115574]RAK90227.1 hypothetical protein BO79DRAFT_253642 [Aspergillus costaricaensis CBS 115574]